MLSGSLIIARRLASSITVNKYGDNVAHVKLNRPEKRNAFTLDMWKEMKSTFDRLADDPTCRAIVLSGEGKSFCSGIDLGEGMGEIIKVIQSDQIEFGRKAREVRRFITICQDGFTAIQKCPKPVVAAVHSHCVGAGVDLITACDVRYAAADSIFSIKEVDIGLAADVGTLNRINQVVGSDSWVREVALTARDFGTDEALRQGFLSRVFQTPSETLQAALELADIIAKKSPIAVQGTKEVLNYARDHTTEDSLNFVKTWNMSQLLSTDVMDSAFAAMQKKKATYKDV